MRYLPTDYTPAKNIAYIKIPLALMDFPELDFTCSITRI